MSATIVWSPEAREDILEIVKFITRDSPIRALAVAQHIESQVEKLAVFPNAGSPVRELSNSPVRELIVYSYRVIFLPEPERIAIVGIIHGARRLRRALRGRRTQ